MSVFSRIPRLVSWVLAASLVAGAGLALAEHGLVSGVPEPTAAECTPTEEEPCPEPSLEPSLDPCVPTEEEPCPEPSQAPDEGSQEDGLGEGEAPAPASARESECLSAAGLEQIPDAQGEKTVGLDRAIEQVFGNCVKNPQAPGLLNALERLASNKARKEARLEAKESRIRGHAASAGKGRGKGKGPGKGKTAGGGGPGN